MKKIEAIIRKSKFDEVVKALHDAEVYFFSYWDVTGVGNEKIGKVYRGITYSTKDIQRRIRECHEKTCRGIGKSVETLEKGQRHIYEENRVFGA